MLYFVCLMLLILVEKDDWKYSLNLITTWNLHYSVNSINLFPSMCYCRFSLEPWCELLKKWETSCCTKIVTEDLFSVLTLLLYNVIYHCPWMNLWMVSLKDLIQPFSGSDFHYDRTSTFPRKDGMNLCVEFENEHFVAMHAFVWNRLGGNTRGGIIDWQ